MRYKLRSSTKAQSEANTKSVIHEPQPSTSSQRDSSETTQPPEKKARMTVCRRRIVKHQLIKNDAKEGHSSLSNTNILDLGVDVSFTG